MATMVKEKPRTKKKTKEKHVTMPEAYAEVPPVVDLSATIEDEPSTKMDTLKNLVEDNTSPSISFTQGNTENIVLYETDLTLNDTLSEPHQSSISLNPLVSQPSEIESQAISTVDGASTAQNKHQPLGAYKDVCHRLDIVTLKDISTNSDASFEELESKLETSISYLNMANESVQSVIQIPNSESVEIQQIETVDRVENAMPSAPIFEEALDVETPVETQEVLQDIRPKVQCMPIEVAMHMCGGKEMAEVREMSEREEAIVQAGPLSGPEHPLVDLLSTFRRSITALDQENHKVMQGYLAEEKNRLALWKIKEYKVCEHQNCTPCGGTIWFKGKYDHAELMKSKLPAAQLRLEGMLKDVQESYCHHQHAALLAYCQIEEFISETLQSSKGEIREATALVLHELRMCDRAPPTLSGALRRWARALCGALLDARDPRQVLFLMHHLFRQNHSVSWAAPQIRIPMCDGCDAARALALLDLLLARPVLEAARECTEESEEMWEEVDKYGGGGAVSEGALRERDLLALLRAFPLRALVARLALLTRADITQTRPYEWQYSAREVLRALCGVRVLLGTLRRAARAHAHYPRLRAALRALAQHALRAAAALHAHNRDSYSKEMENRIEAELEALFVAGCELAGSEGRAPPAALLAPPARAAFCITLMTRLHENSSLLIEPLSIELPQMPCAQRVRVVAQAAIDCDDHELTRMVLDFLAQTALKRKSSTCRGACDGAARECLSRLLSAHEYLYATSLHIVAALQQLEPLQPSAGTLQFLSLQRWRPAAGELRAVLADWAQRCPQLLPSLLHELSYTPYDGLSLESQLTVGSWLSALPAPAPEWSWAVLTRLRVHRSSWGLPLDAPPPENTSSVFAEAYAVLSSSWGHSLPVICEHGVGALCRVAAAHAPAAAHALPLVMAAMASSPESVSLTPQFATLLTTLLAPAQSLAQWARGERGRAPDLLLRRMLAHIEGQSAATREATVSAWLHGLCHVGLPGPRLSVCDAALLADRRVRTLQEAPRAEFLAHLVRNAQHAPLACEAALRAAHAHRELGTQLFVKLLQALAVQRAKGQKIHVDNALKQIGSTIGSEELIIYQTATAVLAAPCTHPAHLALWRLLMHLYLHTPTNSQDTAPIGILFFSGLIKSRTLVQLKKRLQESITYHHDQVESYKALLNRRPDSVPTTSGDARSKSVSPETNMLPATSIAELTGESSDSEDLDDSADDEKTRDDETAQDDATVSASEEKRRVNVNMLKYHEMAEKMLREYACWLEAGERLRATPHHADIARFIPEPALNTAWTEQLNSMRPPPSPEDDDLRPPRQPSPPEQPPSPLQTAVKEILNITDRSMKRSQAPVIKSPVEDVNFGNQRQLLSLVDKHLTILEKLAKEWAADVERVSLADSKLWPLVGALYKRFPLTPCVRYCSNKCGPVVFSLQGYYEWRISEGAASAVKDNRSSARAAVRNLCRARPQLAWSAAALNTIARRVRGVDAAAAVAERAWRCAGAAPPCAPAHAALRAAVDELAERWICSDSADSDVVSSLVSRWSARTAAPAQQALGGALLARAASSARTAARPRLYTGLLSALHSHEPQRAFSYLSKFDMSRCEVTESQRGEMLEALSQAAQRWGRQPAGELRVLTELIGVHTVALMTPQQVSPVVLTAARAAAAGRVPASHLAHVARGCACAARVPLDQLGHLLRELGVIWWEARLALRASGATYHAEYAQHVAALQHALLRAVIAAGLALSYVPERVSWYAWSGLQESWAAWVSPHPALPPLLPAAGVAPGYRAMLKRFVDSLHQMMLDCPGCEEHLLSQVWEWTIQTYLNVTGAPPCDDNRVQLSDFLGELSALPWREHQWPRTNCLPAALQISSTADVEMQTWVAKTLRGVEAATWMRDVTDCDVAPRLAALLQLFAGPLRLGAETLEQAVHLPWHRLPELALDQALERFFVDHHNPLLPYHEAPQFRVILAASGLSPPAARARPRRACAVSQWTRAASAPPLHAHVAAHARALLDVVAALEPFVEEASDELEELLSRAVVILCMEPAAAAALPVWEQWAGGAPARLLGACASAARALTTLDYFAPLADAAVAAHMSTGTLSRWAGGAPARLLGACASAARALTTLDYFAPLADAAVAAHMSTGTLSRWAGGAPARLLGACASAARALTTLDYFAPLADAAVAAHMSTGTLSRWAGGAPARLLGACASAARALTTLDYFAPLADAAVAAHMSTANGSWAELARRLHGCAWAEPGALLARGCLHAAYALALSAPAQPHSLVGDLHFVEKELIVSVWIVALCRVALAGGAGGAGGAQLAKWAEPPRLAILRAVLPGADQPTHKHRLLCRLALCIITPGSEPLARAYEAACPGALGSCPDALAWARAPSITHLPMLALKLYPGHDNYFTEEIKMAAAM